MNFENFCLFLFPFHVHKILPEVTALEVDSADCFVEISVVAWDVDGRQMLQYHRKVWELREENSDGKAHHSSDFRVPTEGAIWGGFSGGWEAGTLWNGSNEVHQGSDQATTLLS